MAVLANRAWMSTATTGTGTITLGTAQSGYQTFADAGIANADVVAYTIVDGSAWEVGTGTYTSAGTTLTRTVTESSNSDSAINLSGSATVFITARKEDLRVSSTTDNAAARFDGTAGLQQNSAFLIDDSGHVSSFGGNIKFPATQSASADANTLDDYEEGTWTPVITFATAGDLSVAYSQQVGFYTKIGRLVTVSFALTTSTFTHTTASGTFQITGLPFTSANSGQSDSGAIIWAGITKASYTSVVAVIAANASLIALVASGSAQNASTLTTTDTPTGGIMLLRGTVSYIV